MIEAVGVGRTPHHHNTGRRSARIAALAGCLALAVTGGATVADSTSGSAESSTATISPLGKPVRTDLDSGSASLTLDDIRASEADRIIAQGYDGSGIDVAMIDTGVDPVLGLHAPGKVLYGPDLSDEGAELALVNKDSYGHGTHLAGIIAGDDGLGSAGFRGVAPGARIVSLKVAGANGETDLVRVIAAIEWAVEHRNTDGLNIRVLNIALGADGVPSSLEDPLSAAVERAWDAGIVVVVAAGNRGASSNGLDSPAISPYVIATGALDGVNRLDGVADFSSAGNGERDPDLVAPGASVVSLRAPGSTLDVENPEARQGTRFFRGSGTSQAAAVMSGSAALLLSGHPELTPDEVKYLVTNYANDVDKRNTELDGAGKLRIDTAEDLVDMASRAPTQDHPRALGITSWDGVDSWTGGEWVGASWSGASWSGASWSGASWSGASWSGASWSGASWSGASWSGASWSGASWSGVSWSTIGFTGSSWS